MAKKLLNGFNIIAGAAVRNGYTMKDLCDITGLPYQTMMQERKAKPETFKVYEIQAIDKAVNLYDEELLAVIRGIG